MIQVPKRFKAYEVVDRATFERFGEQSWMFFRPELIQVLDELSDGFPGKAIIVNNWKSGGPFEWRGLRTKDCTQGAKWGAHYLGAAVDFNVAGMASKAVYYYIIGNQGKFPSIRRMEDIAIATSWSHVDTIETNKVVITIIRP